MATFVPTLHFNGRCEEAIELYRKAFDAVVTVCLRYSDADIKDYDKQLTNEQQNMIYHSELMIGQQRMMLADEIDIELFVCNSGFLTVCFDGAAEVRKAFEYLEDGGTVIYPLHSTTYSACSASIIDKFGFRWGLMTETT